MINEPAWKWRDSKILYLAFQHKVPQILTLLIVSAIPEWFRIWLASTHCKRKLHLVRPDCDQPAIYRIANGGSRQDELKQSKVQLMVRRRKKSNASSTRRLTFTWNIRIGHFIFGLSLLWIKRWMTFGCFLKECNCLNSSHVVDELRLVAFSKACSVISTCVNHWQKRFVILETYVSSHVSCRPRGHHSSTWFHRPICTCLNYDLCWTLRELRVFAYLDGSPQNSWWLYSTILSVIRIYTPGQRTAYPNGIPAATSHLLQGQDCLYFCYCYHCW